MIRSEQRLDVSNCRIDLRSADQLRGIVGVFPLPNTTDRVQKVALLFRVIGSRSCLLVGQVLVGSLVVGQVLVGGVVE